MGRVSGLWGCVDEIPQCELYRTYQYGDEHLRMPCRPQDAHAIAKTENQIWPSYIWDYAENDSGQRHVEGDSYASLRQPPLSHFLLNPFSKLPICLLIVFHRANLVKTHEITHRQNKYFLVRVSANLSANLLNSSLFAVQCIWARPLKTEALCRHSQYNVAPVGANPQN